MRRDLLDILVCPMCKGTLQLTVVEEESEEVVRGSLTCSQCAETYPITDSIPNLLPPDLRRAEEQKAEV